MNYDKQKVADVTLALMALGRHEEGGRRTWKGFDWGAMNLLHEQGYISNPVGKAKSVILTDEGVRRCEELFEQHFGLDSAEDTRPE